MTNTKAITKTNHYYTGRACKNTNTDTNANAHTNTNTNAGTNDITNTDTNITIVQIY